ncbi:MAG: twin-arginine translocase subunit TatC, partial [Bryobacteraceae bacterium]
TPTPDIFNLMLFATPMCLLFYVGIFASYLLVLSREKQKFPWGKVMLWVGMVALAIAGVIYFAVTKYGYHFELRWPFLIR